MMGRLVLVSPHPDDIALSLGGWLAADPARHEAIEPLLVTVFTRSRYAPYAERARDPDEIQLLRESEDRAYADSLHLSYQAFGLPDCSMIGLDDETELTAPDAGDPRYDDVLAALEPVLADASLIVGPAAVGRHIDHRLVHRAVAELRGNTPLLWYEDLPYALTADTGDLPSDPLLTRLEFPAADWRDAKHAGLVHYASQLSESDIQDVLTGTTRGSEFVWTTGLPPQSLLGFAG